MRWRRRAIARAQWPRASTSCSRSSASQGSATGRRGGSPAASSSGWRSRARSPATPQVLFLDEPTASLDPAATKAIEDVVRAVAARGIKVVMSTHDLGEARRLAGEIVLLHRGRVIESGPARRHSFDSPEDRRRAGSWPASCSSDGQQREKTDARRRSMIAVAAVVMLPAATARSRRTSRSWSPRPPRRRIPACSATCCRCSRPRPAST